MTKEELLAKDWQLLTATSLISQSAYLKTIIENQNFIISKLCDIPLSDVTKQCNEHLAENQKLSMQAVEKNIPDYPPEGRSFI